MGTVVTIHLMDLLVTTGYTGDDALDGGDGYDRIDFRGSTAAVVVDLALGSFWHGDWN